MSGNSKYSVYLKAFKTGEWYEKTKTDSFAAACSVANGGNGYGRASRVIDNTTGEILREEEEDASMKACNGYV